MKACLLNVNLRCLAELLGLPEEAVVIGIAVPPDAFGTVQLRVAGVGPEATPGRQLRAFTPTLETARIGDKRFTRAWVDFE